MIILFRQQEEGQVLAEYQREPARCFPFEICAVISLLINSGFQHSTDWMKTLQTWKYHRQPRVTLSRAEEKRHLWHETAGCPCTFPVTSSVPQELTVLISNITGWSACSWVSCKWNHMACAVLCVCLLLLSIARETHPGGCVWQSFTLFPCWIQFHCMNIPHCNYPSYFWVVSDFVAVNICLGPHMFQMVLCKGCTNLPSAVTENSVCIHLLTCTLPFSPLVSAPLPFFSWSRLCCLSSCLALFSS